jgi:hypothetical protein
MTRDLTFLYGQHKTWEREQSHYTSDGTKAGVFYQTRMGYTIKTIRTRTDDKSAGW